ncbi:prostacyclin synthase [Diplocarpon rosae]|nr:prostacyclin synthase [Diplocarpon rosae]
MSAPHADPYSSCTVGYGHLYPLSCGLVIAAAVICIPWFMNALIMDHRDPPIVQSKIPLIGHLLGILTQQADYYQTLRIHVITSPSLVQSVFRNAKTLSFDPITTSASKKIFQMTDRQTKLLQGIASHEEGEEEYPVAKATYQVMHATLQPSASLFQTTAVALQRFASSLDVIGTQGDEVQLYEWLQHHFTMATAEALLLLEQCPLLSSCWQETLRLRAASIPNRVVVADTALDDAILLRKGGVVQLPCQTMHTSPTIWGRDASAFDPSRFLASTTAGLDKESRKSRKQAYNPFGGGAVLCPGRHFSSMEIVGVAAMLVKGFEIQGVRVLGVKMQGLSEQVKHPDGDLKVIIRRREGWQGLGWRFEVSGEGGSSMFK